MGFLGKRFGPPANSDAAITPARPTPEPATESHRRIVVDANSLSAAGRFGEALVQVAAALASAPENQELLFARASIFFGWGRYRDARDGYMRAHAAGMRGTALELQLGWSHFHCGNLNAAEACMRRAVALEPGDRRTRAGLARVLFSSGRHVDAEIALNSALELCPGDFECLWLLGNCKLGQGNPVAGEEYLRMAVAADSQRAVAWKDLGSALDAQDRRQEAMEASATAMRLEETYGENGDAFVNLAILLADDGRLSEALALHEQRLPLQPYVYGHVAYAQALLKAGRLREGWQQYEFRLLCEPLLSRRQAFGRPAWSGQDLQGKTILLLAEQGLGDTIQFIRYAPRLKALGANVLLRVPDGVEAFAQGFPGVDKVLERGATRADFDYFLNVISLPHVIGIEGAAIPAAIPYLRADAIHESKWATRLQSNGVLRIGLVWAGNPNHAADRHRSMSLATLAPLGEVSGARFFALQKGAREDEAANPPPGFVPVNLGPDLADFRDTAAVIGQLDLVLSVDTAVAHLAGAMGKPVWLMLPKAAEWRWLEGREDTPWYPTMRLFRQRRQGDWSDVVDQVRTALRSRLKDGRAKSPALPAAAVPVRGAITNEFVRSADSGSRRADLSAVAETRMGILQYLPAEPLVGDSLQMYGELLQPQVDLLAQRVRTGATVLEIGSGVGAHAVSLAAMVGGDGHLMLYESRPVQQQILRQNLAANRSGNVTLMRGTTVGSSTLEREQFTRDATTVATTGVPTETLDELHLDRLDLLKVNTGVAAIDVLAGAAATLWRLRPSLFIAVPDDAALTRSAAHLREFGYRCWRMKTPWFNPLNFNRREEDIFARRTALALVAIAEESEGDVAQSGCAEIS